MDSTVSISLRSFDETIEEGYRTLFPGDPGKSPDLLNWPYTGPFQAGQPLTVTSSCNATSTWLAAATNQPPPAQGQRGERGR